MAWIHPIITEYPKLKYNTYPNNYAELRIRLASPKIRKIKIYILFFKKNINTQPCDFSHVTTAIDMAASGPTVLIHT